MDSWSQLLFKSRQGTNRRKPLTVKALSDFAKHFTGHQWVKIVEAVNQPVQRVRVHRRGLAGLKAAQQNPGTVQAANAQSRGYGRWRSTQKERSGDTACRADL